MLKRAFAAASAAGVSFAAFAAPPQPPTNNLPSDKPIGVLETVATFSGPMPTGVSVAQNGRIFVNFPRWGDNVPYTVAEVVNGKTIPYPNAAFNRLNRNDPANCLVCVQSVVVDAKNRLWILDPAAPLLGPALPNGPKLVCVDLATNKITKKIVFDASVVPSTSYLNDVRFDLRKGKAGVAYITDSGAKGSGGIIVVDLASGNARRLLANHPSVNAAPKFLPSVEGQPLMKREKNKPPQYLDLKSDGIAISADGSRLFYCPLASRHLYSVPTDVLLDETQTADEVSASVTDHGEKGSASDGLEQDNKNRIYATAYEQNAVLRRLPDGTFETVVHDARLLWPDTMSIAGNYLYVTANQLHRQKNYHNGRDERVKPYALFRIKIDAGPVLLK